MLECVCACMCACVCEHMHVFLPGHFKVAADGRRKDSDRT